MHTSLTPIEQPIADMSSYPGLALANGLTWGLQAVDQASAEAVVALSLIMQLLPQHEPQHLLRIRSAASGPSFTLLSGGPGGSLLSASWGLQTAISGPCSSPGWRSFSPCTWRTRVVYSSMVRWPSVRAGA